jgi:DNA invertase Pin-like site-specific DNA recombinase
MKEIIGYIRVSTDEQGTAGNGLDAQRAAIIKFAQDNNYTLLSIVQEVASGKLGLEDRPVLKAAIARSLKEKAMLVVSKLDRLSRHAAFVLNLMDTKANFCVAELGENVSPFMLHIYAVVAQQERELISRRTTDALAALKAKGVILGNKKNIEMAQQNGGFTQMKKSDDFAKRMQPSITRMREAGMTLKQIAEEFNTNGTKTMKGGAWSAAGLCNLIKRF